MVQSATVTANPFITYLRTHPNADESAIKELFRILAKRTHPDLGADGSEGFVRLQEAYHDALAAMIASPEAPARGRAAPTAKMSPRDLMLRSLYRYKARLASVDIDARPLTESCTHAFREALLHAEAYDRTAYRTLTAFDAQFHAQRAIVERYPDVRTKYRCLIHGLSAFFDYQVMPNAFNARVARSYLAEIRRVDDFDPHGPPELRSNRSAAARSALYQMKVLLESELALPVCSSL